VSGHPARSSFAAGVREFGLMLMAVHEDDVMMQHGTAALWVSAHGRVFTRQAGPLPAGIAAGQRGKCFANAQQGARDHGLRYIEGFAGPSPAGEWTLHAWNASRRGRVIDTTWPGEPGARGHYLGIEFTELPGGERAGISLLADLLGGKLIIVSNRTGRVQLLNGDGELAELVRADGGFAATGEAIPGSRRYGRAKQKAGQPARRAS
jgi:hypothetical protein